MMTYVEKERKFRRMQNIIRNYAVFFLTMCGVLTVCMILFLTLLRKSADIKLTAETIRPAAVFTFVNIVFLSLIFTAIDSLRHYLTVTRPVRRITQAAEKVMQGDLSVRIDKSRIIDPDDGFNVVIGYFNRMIQELSGMETLRLDFISNVSHELKTPMAVIQNYATLLQQPELGEENRIGYAKATADAARNLAGMVSNILKLNKLENQTIYPDTTVYDLGEQLCECLLGFEDAWEKKNLDIRADLAENVLVKADPELLSLAWNNLFSNAVKFTEPGGTVSLELAAEEGQAVVRISDTGCGISPETGKHIFEKFYQGDTSHATQGNGLGLALVKRVIDITGGSIGVSSELGKGSTFTVKLEQEKGDSGLG